MIYAFGKREKPCGDCAQFGDDPAWYCTMNCGPAVQPEPPMIDNLRCIVCDRPLENIQGQGVQPSKGLAFATRGHYGSQYFDPMDGSVLEICVCDECVQIAEAKRKVWRWPARRD